MICLTKPCLKLHRFHSNDNCRRPPSLHFHPLTPLPISSATQEPRKKTLQSGQKRAYKVNSPLLSAKLQQLPLPAHRGAATAGKHLREGRKVWGLCGYGYWMQGFRCFPWLALNFHLVHALSLSPSYLQLVQNIGNLPMVAKPLLGVLSDAVYIGGAHRIPYISIGVLLQLMSWGTLALIPITGDTFATQMTCILLGNLGASFTEVVSDALVAEFSKRQKAGVLQSYAFIALAAGALLGNLSGGFVLLRTRHPQFMFLVFALLLSTQLAFSLTAKESSIYSPNFSSSRRARSSLSENISKQLSNLMTAVSEERILYPLSWIVASVAIVPILSGTMFCYQTQCLKLDPSVIGLSKVIGQIMVLLATVFYERYLKRVSMRRLIFGAQVLYALSLASDLLLVKQINVMMGISNEAYVLCLSSLAEAVAQFKILPFTILFSRLCPSGCEGSLFAFLGSAICLSSIVSGIVGVGLASFIGMSSGDYSNLPLGIAVQFMAALVPLGWISSVPIARNMEEMRTARRKS